MIRDPGRRAYHVRIRFHPPVTRNVAEVHWHKTQRTAWNADGTLDFRVTVASLKEIEWWVLGYGRSAEVIEPAELRRAVLKHAQTLSERYAPSSQTRARGSGVSRGKR